MADDKTKRGSPDNKRLNKSEPYEVAYAKSKRAKAATSKTAKTSAKDAAKKATTRARRRARHRPPFAGSKTSTRGPSRRRRR